MLLPNDDAKLSEFPAQLHWMATMLENPLNDNERQDLRDRVLRLEVAAKRIVSAGHESRG